MSEQTPKTCAACGGPTIHSHGSDKEFCSPECRLAGRAFCKYCDKPLSPRKFGKVYCDKSCLNKYYRRKGPIDLSYLAERFRSTCIACNKPITQPRNGGKKFCSNACFQHYHTARKHSFSLTEDWGGYPPQTRKALRNVAFNMGPGAATQIAMAIDLEYLPRSKRHQRDYEGTFITYHCKTCGKEFRRRPHSMQSRDYCDETCVPKRSQRGGREGGRKFTPEEVDEIRHLYTTTDLGYGRLAHKYGVTFATIKNIVTYRTYPNGQQRVERKPKAIHPNRIAQLAAREIELTHQYERADEIRRLYETEHLSQRALMKRYGVSKTSIADIVNYKSYKPENDPRRKESTP